MRWRLVAVLLGVTAMILIVHDVPLASHLRRVERDRLITGLERDGFTIAGRSEELLEAGAAARPDDAAAIENLLTDYRTRTGGRVIVWAKRNAAARATASDTSATTSRPRTRDSTRSPTTDAG